MRSRLIAFSVLLAASPAAGATGTAETAATLRQFGLFGLFADRCGEPASPNNVHSRLFRDGPDRIKQESSFGPGHGTNVYHLLSAKALSDSLVELKVILHPGTKDEVRQTLTWLVKDGTRRTMTNLVGEAAYVVKDGVIIGNGRETPSIRKCE